MKKKYYVVQDGIFADGTGTPSCQIYEMGATDVLKLAYKLSNNFPATIAKAKKRVLALNSTAGIKSSGSV